MYTNSDVHNFLRQIPLSTSPAAQIAQVQLSVPGECQLKLEHVQTFISLIISACTNHVYIYMTCTMSVYPLVLI